MGRLTGGNAAAVGLSTGPVTHSFSLNSSNRIRQSTLESVEEFPLFM